MRVLIARYPATLEIETELATEPAEFVQLAVADRSTVGTIIGESAVASWIAERGAAATPEGKAIQMKARAWFGGHRAGANLAAPSGQPAMLRLLPLSEVDP